MSKSCVLLILFNFAIGLYASKVPFIEKCVWSDKACLLSSSQKALPYFTKGLPELGIQPSDPLKLAHAKLNEGGLNIEFSDMTITGVSKCKFTDVERNTNENWLSITAECPIEVVGKYKASGKLFVAPIEGDGPFSVKSNNIRITVKLGLSLGDGADGQKHWKISKPDYSYDIKEKAYMKFENLFNGDKEKSDAIHAIIDQSWKDLVLSVGKPIVIGVCDDLVVEMKRLADTIPANELEL